MKRIIRGRKFQPEETKHWEAVLLRLEPELLQRIDASWKRRAKRDDLPNIWTRSNEMRHLLLVALRVEEEAARGSRNARRKAAAK